MFLNIGFGCSKATIVEQVESGMVQAIKLDEKYRLLFLPSGCWLCVPEKLETTVHPRVASVY